MATSKNILQAQGDQQMKKSASSSPQSVQQGSQSINKQSQQTQSIVRDSIGQNLAQRIKKAKDEIFVQSHQRKGKSGEKKKQKNSQMEEEDNIFNNKTKESNKKKGNKNANAHGIPSEMGIKINLIQDENLNVNLAGNSSLLFNPNKMQEEFDNEEHSDFNSNQIECSNSNRNQDEDDDPFMDDLIQQKNQEFGSQFPLIGGNIDPQKFISIIFNKSEGAKDTTKQPQQQKQQKGKKAKEKKEESSAAKQQENGNSSAKGKKNNADPSSTEPKPKREYKKKAKKSENSEQDAMKNSQIKVSGEDQPQQSAGNSFNLNIPNSSLAQQNAISNSNSTTPKNNISKNIIILNHPGANQQGGQQGGQQNITNENYNNSNGNPHSSSAAAGGSSSTKKGFRQYNKEIKMSSNQGENSNQPQIIDEEGLINLFLQVQQGFQIDKGDENQQQQNSVLNATLEALLQGSSQANQLTATPNNTTTSKRKQKGESKIKPFQDDQQQGESNQKSNQKQKILSTPAKSTSQIFQEPNSVNCRLNMDIENIGNEQYESNIISNQALQATATTAPSSSSKKSKIHNNNEHKEKSEEKPKKKLKTSQDDLGDNSLQQTPQLIGLTSGKKSKKEKKQKEIIPEQQTFKNASILNVTKTDNSLLVQLSQAADDPEQQEIERQIEEFSFTKEVKHKQNPEEIKAEQEALKNSKVFNLLWEKQQIYKRKLELYQLSSFERYQQHKILEMKTTYKHESFYIPDQQMHEKSYSDKREDQGLANSGDINESDKSEVQQSNIFSLTDQIKVNRELSFSGPNVSNSMHEEEEEQVQENNQQENNSSNKVKSSSAIVEEKADEVQIKQEDENPENKKSSKKEIKDDKDTRNYTQKFQDLRNKFLMLKQTFKPSIITA